MTQKSQEQILHLPTETQKRQRFKYLNLPDKQSLHVYILCFGIFVFFIFLNLCIVSFIQYVMYCDYIHLYCPLIPSLSLSYFSLFLSLDPLCLELFA